MGFDLVKQILRRMQFVASKDDEASGRGVAQQGRDENIRVNDELQGPSPRPPGLAPPVLLPDAFLH